MKDTHVLVLAAGLGTRMKSDIPKVLHQFDGKPIISRIVETLKKTGFDEINVVVGHKAEIVEEFLKKQFSDINFKFIRQKLLKGSGRAVIESLDYLNEGKKNVLILSGDVPLIKTQTLNKLYKIFKKNNLAGALISCIVDDPKEYGRVIKDEKNNVVGIVESSDLSEKEKVLREINAGIYIFKLDFLKKALSKLRPSGPKKEYYLTDVVKYINLDGGRISTLTINDVLEISGPNSKKDLVELERNYYYSNALKHLDNGVVIKDVRRAYISFGVKIKKDAVIYPDVYISGKSIIGKSIIGPNVVINDSIIEDECEIKPFTIISSSKIRKGSIVGPFSHIRPESDIGPKAKIGNFSEIKKSRIKDGSKIPHLSYVGDAEVGKNVNIGAGTITCNYDGVKKHKTIIKDGAFVGSNTNLVAPIVIGRDVLIGAGSTITEDVEDGKLAIARARQIVKDRKK